MRADTLCGRPGAGMTYSVRPLCYLVLLPLIVTALTAAFLGYAAWRLTDLAWLLTCLTCHRLFARRVAPR